MKRLKSLNKILPAIATLLLLSCNNCRLHNYKSVGGEWSKDSSLVFVQNSLLNASVAQPIDCYVGVRYSAAYKYKNLCLQVASYHNDSLLRCDTICCDMYDDAGHRKGSTAGTLYQAEYYVASTLLPGRSTYTVRLKHLMDDSLLQGIYDVGLKLVPRGRHQYAGN